MEKNIPSQAEMERAFFGADSSYDGIFYTGVRTTGIFCRPSCSARKPLKKNIEFFPTARDALYAGYRPCKRCEPMVQPGDLPEQIKPVVAAVDADPGRRWRDADLRKMGLEPATVRRWFQKVHGMTFHAYARARRLGQALDEIRRGSAVTRAAFDHGYDSLSGFGEAIQRMTGDSPARQQDRVTITVGRILTPLGPMLAGSVNHAVCLLEFADRRMLERQLRTLEKRLDAVLIPGWDDTLETLRVELDEYFAGQRTTFTVPLAAPGTDFQETVWKALLEIPNGETWSYEDLARHIGNAAAVRAVARANGDNRIAILIPCHRVIGKNGKLTGYGGGLWRKQRLLEIELSARTG